MCSIETNHEPERQERGGQRVVPASIGKKVSGGDAGVDGSEDDRMPDELCLALDVLAPTHRSAGLAKFRLGVGETWAVPFPANSKQANW